MSNAPNVQVLKLAGFGRCIYCKSDGGGSRLTDEHIVPFSLGGRIILQNSSCKECARITTNLDGYLANVVFRELRIHRKLQSRRSTTKKTKRLPATYRIDGGPWQTREFDLADHPYFLALPRLRQPGILIGQPSDAHFYTKGSYKYAALPPHFSKVIGAREDQYVEVRKSIEPNLPTFCRAVAKIAYCHAVATYGLDAFYNPDCPAMILDKFHGFSFYVGGVAEDDAPPATDHLHFVDVGTAYMADGRCLVTGDVRFFPKWGMAEGIGLPVYRVVIAEIIGEPPKPINAPR